MDESPRENLSILIAGIVQFIGDKAVRKSDTEERTLSVLDTIFRQQIMQAPQPKTAPHAHRTLDSGPLNLHQKPSCMPFALSSATRSALTSCHH